MDVLQFICNSYLLDHKLDVPYETPDKDVLTFTLPCHLPNSNEIYTVKKRLNKLNIPQYVLILKLQSWIPPFTTNITVPAEATPTQQEEKRGEVQMMTRELCRLL